MAWQAAPAALVIVGAFTTIGITLGESYWLLEGKVR